MNNRDESERTWEERFVGYLLDLARREDRGTLAKLRRGLGKEAGFAPNRDGWVIARLPQQQLEWGLDAHCLIASLFALHPEPEGKGSLGASFHSLQERTGGEGVERRFVVLLDSDVEDLPGRLRHTVSLLKAKEIPIDWALLLRHLQHWDHPTRWVQKVWARDFWAGRETEEAGELPITVPASNS